MTLSLRHRLIAVVVLAAIACGGAVFAIVFLARSSNEQRVERAREYVSAEVERRRDPAARPWMDPPRERAPRGEWWRRSGYLDASFASNAPDARRGPGGALQRAIAEGARESASSGELTIREVENPLGTLVVGVAPVPGGGYAWAAARVPPSHDSAPWRVGVWVLAAATLALVMASLHALVSFQRGADSLRRSLGAVALDLRAPVERPVVRELADVASHVATLAAALATARDEHAALTRELADRERLASIGRVAAGVAHEVRNPLAAIKLRADLALRSADVSPALARDLGDISSEVARLDRLVADLLVVTGRRVGPMVATDIATLVARRAALLSAWAEARRVNIVTAGAGSAAIEVDAIARVVDNLVRNAVEASPPGADVDVQIAASDATVSVTVTDSGPGVPQARESELFEPFFTTKPDGTGLGLALCRAIAAAHRGTVTYVRDLDRTRFTLTLPLTPQPAQAST